MTTAYDSGNVPPIEVRHRLRIAREYAELEQDELAELIGVSRNTIGNAEKGRVQPRRITLNAWALACGVPVSWLIAGGEQSGGPGSGPGCGPTPITGGPLVNRGAGRPVDPNSGLRISSTHLGPQDTERAA